MKRLILTTILIAWYTLAGAQTADTTATNTTPQPAASTMELVQLHPESGQLRLEVAGYGITLGNRNFKVNDEDQVVKTSVKRVRCSIGLASLEMGSSMLTGASYGAAWAGDGDFLETKAGFHFAIEPLRLRVMLDRNSHWWVSVGLRYSVDNYVFSNPLTLQRTDGVIHPVDLDPSTKKSKLLADYMSIPLRLTFSPVRKLNITLHASGDLLLSSHTKYKKPKNKASISGLSPWCWRVGGAISYHRIGIYADYSLTPLFKAAAAPAAHALSIGAYFGF